eukprot:scaffold1172_cov115-Cylindrotheca_fusiformis.AAC.12
MARSILAPLAPIFQILNWVAFAGWAYVFVQLVGKSDETDTELIVLVKGLECICLVEVLRIMLGDLKGNLSLGLFLHGIRMASLFQVFPRLPTGHWTFWWILFAWSLSEVTRYPMYMFPSSSTIRSVRMVAPLLTFPIGCYSEACAAYLVLMQEKEEGAEKHPWWLLVILGTILFVNGVLGPTQAMPALVQKGLPALGLAKEQPKTTKAPKEVKRI